MANWGSIGDYGGGVLWNQAPWLNNQDLFVVKDDYSAVFGKHFVKVGVLVSYNKKNEEVNNTSQESVQVNGVRGFLGPERLRAGHDGHRQHHRELAARGHGLEHRRAPDQPERAAALEGLRGVHRRHLQGELARDRRRRRALHPLHRALRGRRPHGQLRSRTRSTPPSATAPATGCSTCPGTNPCADVRASRAERTGRTARCGRTKAVLIAPRLGVAWDVFGTGKTAVRGGLGLFYARERLSIGPGPRHQPAVLRHRLRGPHARLEPGRSPAAPASRSAPRQRPASSRTRIRTTGSGTSPSSTSWCATRSSRWPTSATRAATSSACTNVNEVRSAEPRSPTRGPATPSLRPLNGIAGIGDGNIGVLDPRPQLDLPRPADAAREPLRARARRPRWPTRGPSRSRTRAWPTPTPASATPNAYTDSTQPDLDRGRVRGRQDAHLLRQPRPRPAHAARTSRRLRQDTSSATGRSRASSRRPRVPDHGLPRRRPRPLRERQQPRGHGLRRSPAAQPRPRPALPRQRRLGDAVAEPGGVDASTTTRSAPTATPAARICDGPGSSRWTPRLYKNIRLGKNVQAAAPGRGVQRVQPDQLPRRATRSPMTWTPENVVFDTGNGATATRIISATPSSSFGQLIDSADNRQAQFGIRLQLLGDSQQSKGL